MNLLDNSRPLLIPAAALGLILGGVAMIAWSHGPFGADTALGRVRGDLAAMTERQHVSAAMTHTWAALYKSQGVELKRTRTEAAQAVQNATARSQSTSRTSYAAGVIAGRALERNRNAGVNSGHPDPVADDGSLFTDFRKLWSGGGAASDPGKGLPARSEGGNPG